MHTIRMMMNHNNALGGPAKGRDYPRGYNIGYFYDRTGRKV